MLKVRCKVLCCISEVISLITQCV